MRCSQCDYPLWNLKARQCPECGTPFHPADFEFMPNSVLFCCPHCDQPYYGTDPRGLIEPPTFQCVSCQQQVGLDEMVLRMAPGKRESQTKIEMTPWLERSEFGFFKAWFRMIGLAMTGPNRLARGLPGGSRPGAAWWFFTFSWIVFLLGGLGIPFSVIAILDGNAGPFFVGIGFIAGGLAAVTAAMAVWALSAHLILGLTGGTIHSIGRTFEVMCYSSGAAALYVIPCLGPYCASWVAAIWWVVSATLMLTTGQRVSGGRAAFAVLAVPSLMVLVGAAGYFAWVAYFMVAGMPQVNKGPVAGEGQTVLEAIIDYAQNGDGTGPTHAAQLIVDEGLGTAFFVLQMSETLESDVPVSDATLKDVSMLPTNRLRQTVDGAAAALPDDVIAHRLGDFVMTYHGIDLDTADPGLWLLIVSVDPDQATLGAGEHLSAVGRADGEMVSMTASEVREALAAQNELRAEAGLPPLPDPVSVTHDRPARPGRDP